MSHIIFVFVQIAIIMNLACGFAVMRSTSHGYLMHKGSESYLLLSSDGSGPLGDGAPQKAVDSVTEPSTNDISSYPIDLPSPILLAGSVLLAIVSTGKLLYENGLPSFFTP